MAKGKKSKKAIEAETTVGEMVDAITNEEDKPIEINTILNTILVDPDSLVIRSIMPGILTVFDCHIRGGRKNYKENIVKRLGPDGEEIETYDGKSIIADKAEFKAADNVRSKIHRIIKKLGVDTAVGLIVPAHRKQELAQTMAGCTARVKGWNEKSRTCDLTMRYSLHNVEGNSASTIGAVTEQLHDILAKVNEAVKSDDAKILESATAHQLGDFKTAAEVLAAPIEQRIAIVAKVRADITRKAIAEARSFSTLLPEEAGLAVTDMVATIRKSATEWVKASKESETAYEKAMQAVDIEGISAMQAALVKAAAMADTKAEAETAIEAGGVIAKLDFSDEPEVHTPGDGVAIAMDLFKQSGNEPGSAPGDGTMAAGQ